MRVFVQTALFFEILTYILGQKACIELQSNPSLCFQCSRTHYQKNLSASLSNFSPSDCISRGAEKKSLLIFISTIKCLSSSTCDGSEKYPFDEINRAFLYAYTQANEVLFSEISFYFLGSPHFILLKNLPTISFTYFRRTNATVSMQPCRCEFRNIPGCFASNQFATIHMKTDNFFLFIANALSIQGIIFNGSDIQLSKSTENKTTECYNKEVSCCSAANLGATYNSAANPCGLLTRSNTIDKPEVWSFRYGFLNLEAFLDDPDLLTPSLLLINVSFTNIYSVKAKDSWISLIALGSNARSGVIMSEVSIINSFFVQGFLLVRPLQYFSPKVSQATQISADQEERKSSISLSKLLITSYNFYDNRINIYDQTTNAIIISENFNGNFTIYNVSMSEFSNALTKISLFLLVSQMRLSIFNLTFFNVNNLQFANLLSSRITIVGANITNYRYYRGVNMTQVSVLELSNTFWTNITALDPTSNILVVSSLSSLLVSDSTISSMQNLIQTKTSSSVLFRNSVFKNLTTYRTFLQLRDTLINFENIVFSNITMLPNLYNDFFYIVSVIPIIASFSNISVMNVVNANDSLFFNCVGGDLDIYLIFQNLSFKDSIINNIFFINQIKWVSVSFVTFANSSRSNDRQAVLGTSPFYVTYFSTLSMTNISINALFSRNSLIYVSFCLKKNCEFNLTNATFSELSHYDLLNWIFLSVERIFISNLFVSNVKAFGSEITHSGLKIGAAQEIKISSIIFSLKDAAFACLFEIFESSNLTISTLTVENSNSTGFIFLPILSALSCEEIHINDLRLDSLSGRPYETSILLRSGFLNFIGFESELISQENSKRVSLENVLIRNSGGWPNGIMGFINIHQVLVSNASFINCFASKYAGAIYYNRGGSFTLLNTFFSSTNSFKGGAAVLKNLKSITLLAIIANGTGAREDGGFFFGANIELLNLSNVKLSNVSAGKNGGAIFCENCNVSLNNFTCEYCSAADEGGVLFQLIGASSTIDCSFFWMQAKRGAWAVVKSAILITIENVQISSSVALEKASSLYSQDNQAIRIANLLLQGQRSLKTQGNLFIESQKETNIEVSNLRCISNEAKSGSCIFYNTIGFLALSQIFIINSFGNAIYVNSKSSSDIEVKNLTLANNNVGAFLTTEQAGFILYFANSNLLISGSNFFKNNRAYNSLFYLTSSNFSLNNSTFYGNTGLKDDSEFVIVLLEESQAVAENIIQSQKQKGATPLAGFIQGTATTVHISKSSFEACGSKDGCIILENSCLTLYSSFFISSSGNFAAALFLKNSKALVNSTFFCGNLLTLEPKIYRGSRALQEPSELRAADIFFVVTNITGDCFLKVLSCSFLVPNHSISTFQAHSVEINDCSFINQSSAASSLLIYSGNLTISRSAFIGFSSQEGAVLCLYNLISRTGFLKLSSSIFLNNTSNLGGAIFLQGAIQGSFENSIFLRNSAVGKPGIGGALYFVCLLCVETWLSLINNRFVLNKAAQYGATVFSQANVNRTRVESNINEQNEDAIGFGNDFFSFPTSFLISGPGSQQNLTLEKGSSQDSYDADDPPFISIVSGVNFDINLTIVDSFQHRIFFDNTSMSSFKKGADIDQFLQITGGQGKSSGGLHEIKNIQVNVRPNTTFTMIGSILFDERVFLPKSLETHPANQLVKNLTMYARPCEIGEVFKKGDLSCYKCPREEFSLRDPQNDLLMETQQTCLPCLQNAFCEGGSSISPLPGYWRANNRSTKIVECLSEKYCVGGQLSGLNAIEKVQGACRIKHEGPMCFYCEKGSAKNGRKSACEECRSNYSVQIKLAFGVLMLVIYVFAQAYFTISTESRGSIGILMKQLLTHVQILQMICSINLAWTQDLIQLFKFQDYFLFISDEIMPLDCMFDRIEGNLLIIKLIAANLMPFIVFGMLVVMLVVIKFLKRKFSRVKTKEIRLRVHLKAGAVIIFYIFFPDILNKAFAFLNCKLIDDYSQVQVLLYSPSDACWDSKHYEALKKVFVPTILISGLMVPIAGLCLMLRNGKAIKNYINERKKFEMLESKNMKIVPGELVNNIFKSTASFAENEGSASKILGNCKKMKVSILNKLPRTSNHSKARPDKPAESPKLAHTLQPANILKSHENPSLNETAIALRFIYRGYRDHLYFWEFIIFLKKLFLILISSFSELFPEDTKFNVLLVIFTMFLFLQIRFRPFDVASLNKVEFASLLVSFFTTNVGILLYSQQLRNLSSIFFYFLVFINVLFIGLWGWTIKRPILTLFKILRGGKKMSVSS